MYTMTESESVVAPGEYEFFVTFLQHISDVAIANGTRHYVKT